MCDHCQAKINLLTRKQCPVCSQYFCPRCVSTEAHHHSPFTRSPQTCRRCTIFNSELMEKAQLLELTMRELKQYKGIIAPVSATKETLVNLILGHQAKVLTERAQRAVQQLDLGPVDVLTVDANTLQVPSSAYSSSNSHPTDSASALTRPASSSASSIRSRVRQQFELRKSKPPTQNTSEICRLEDISDKSQIGQLNVKQMKIILQQNCINYRGCVEKSELMERVHQLWQDKASLQVLEAKITADGDLEAEHDYLCKVCMESPVNCVFLDCGHMLTCVVCGRQLAECPVCRQMIVKVVHTFRV